MQSLYRLIKNYGIVGIFIFFKLKLRLSGSISVPGVSHPIRLRVGTSDAPVFTQVFIDQDYSIDLPFDARNIIDAGANVGLAAVYFANKYPKATIVSIEPEKSNFNILQKNVAPYPNVKPVMKALSNEQEVLTVEDLGYGNWGFVTSRAGEKTTESAIVVETITIPQLMRDFGFDHIDIAKIDIEGYEKELFESRYEEWVPKTKCLIVELHDRMKKGTSTSLFKCISQYNFSLTLSGENLVFVNDDL